MYKIYELDISEVHTVIFGVCMYVMDEHATM